MNPPLVGPVRVPRSLRLGCAAAVFLCAGWAWLPAGTPKVIMPVIETPTARVLAPAAVLDTDAFRAPVWVAAATVEVDKPPPPPAPLPPLRVQLLAILREGERLSAALYDEDRDRIVVAKAGELVGSGTVQTVDRASVTIQEQGRTRTIPLSEGSAAR